ncbi:MAG: dihydrolipoyl dehydrogenase [Planctomycetes bacterium RBG_13_63_9]|nr:MAG: dihydrolipoyl dehydrogenase [Planctomycetes bacterium RBG_13_63_9]
MNTQLAVIGGGPGGYAAAFLAADLGMQVTLIDLQPRLGGVCLLRGCIPSKALLHVAKLIAETKQLAEWGVDFSDPVIDVEKTRARKEKVISTLAGGLQQLATRRKVRVIRARASFEDSNALRLEPVGDDPLDDDRVRFDHCIVASGSRPTRLPGFDLATPRVMDSSGALALPDVPESLLVVGGGYIGLELGSVYAALGTRVSVVELTDGLLPSVDRNLVKPLHKRLSQQFEAIWLGTRVVALEDKGDSIAVRFAGETEKDVQRFSRVLVSVGRTPNSADLGLENTEVELDEQGFLVADDRQQTADPRILAIGDVAGQPMLAHKAARQGKVAVEALSGESVTFEPAAIPAVVFTDPEIAWAGLTETQAKTQGRPVQVAQFPWAASGRAHTVGATDGLTKWLVDPQTDRLLGCGIVGSGAGELIGEAVLAIERGTTAHDLARTIHPHPTLSETLAAAAEIYLGTATDLYRPRRKPP